QTPKMSGFAPGAWAPCAACSCRTMPSRTAMNADPRARLAVAPMPVEIVMDPPESWVVPGVLCPTAPEFAAGRDSGRVRLFPQGRLPRARQVQRLRGVGEFDAQLAELLVDGEVDGL